MRVPMFVLCAAFAAVVVSSGAATAAPCDAVPAGQREDCSTMIEQKCARYDSPSSRSRCEAQVLDRFAEAESAGGLSCADVPPHRRAACDAHIEERCQSTSPDSHARCVDRVVGEDFNACTDPAVVDLCRSILDDFIGTCANAAGRPPVKDPVAMALWLDMVAAMPEILGRIDSFERDSGACMEPEPKVPGCDLGAHQVIECKEAAGRFAEQWELAIVGLASSEHVDRELDTIEVTAQRPSFMRVAAQRAKARADQLREMLELNQRSPAPGADTSAITAAITRYEAKRAEILKRHAAMIAAARCPQGAGGAADRRSELATVATSFYEKAEPGDSFAKKLSVFRLDGAASFKVEPLSRIRHEDQPAVACVKQSYPDEAVCRIFRVTMRRTQPLDGSWGPWSWYSIGGGDELLCENMR